MPLLWILFAILILIPITGFAGEMKKKERPENKPSATERAIQKEPEPEPMPQPQPQEAPPTETDAGEFRGTGDE